MVVIMWAWVAEEVEKMVIFCFIILPTPALSLSNRSSSEENSYKVFDFFCDFVVSNIFEYDVIVTRF